MTILDPILRNITKHVHTPEQNIANAASFKEIGSDYEYSWSSLVRSRRRADQLPLESSDSRYLASGRDALHWIVASLGLGKNEKVLLPAYVCEEVLKPFLTHGLSVEFYRVDADLQIDKADLATKLSPDTRLLLYIHYFGFRSVIPKELIARQAHQTTIIEDSTHSFLSPFESSQQPTHKLRTIQFASYRKLLPMPDGAVLLWDSQSVPKMVPAETRRSIRSLASVSLRYTGAGLKHIRSRHPHIYPSWVHRRLFSWSETLLDTSPKPSNMSGLSKRIIRSLDLPEIVQIRRQNFQFLLTGLAALENLEPLYSNLPEDVCPLGFPILVQDRDGLAKHLALNGVYAPIHWELPDSVDKSEFSRLWLMSSRILTLPIDQRYDKFDMSRIVESVKSYLASEVQCPVIP